MLTVEQAESQLLSRVKPWAGCEYLPLSECCGYVLQEELRADRDLPPYDRVAMDGIAVRESDLRAGQRSFRCLGVQAAGDVPLALASEHESCCIEIMTGARLVEPYTHVVPYECVSQDAERFTLAEGYDALQRTNIHAQGSDRLCGNLICEPGTKVTPFVVATAASIGKTRLRVSSGVKVAMLVTGDELVSVDAQPQEHQIRRSNDYAVAALLARWPGVHFSSSHLGDDPQALGLRLSELLAVNEVVLISGGVSMGKFDYVPNVLRELGVREIFHKVAQRPGKPLWFGDNPSTGKVVFGLPGNPVSSLVSTRRFVVPFLEACFGTNRPRARYEASEDVSFAKDFTLYQPVEICDRQQGLVRPLPTNGSGDFSSLVGCDGFIEARASEPGVRAGQSYPFYGWSPDA